MPILETPRLILRSFREEDVDCFAELMANPDFMRFSLGTYTREQTVIPGSFIGISMENTKSKSGIGYILVTGPGACNRSCASRARPWV
jgi:RimJ/RimL family protein N-acetyltransferase